MPWDSTLLENLLYQAEGSALDFKEEQYPFDGAKNDQKGELLKDILAFANSWRQTTAYILVGVEEVKGGRSKIIGVIDHLDDAKLHQFVNSKTQRSVEFSYHPFRTEGREIGVIEIPLQQRPIYIRRDYGKLNANVVYIRDGSSTRPATPDEIAKMGVERVLDDPPQFILEWADTGNRVVLPSPHTVHSLALIPLLTTDKLEQLHGPMTGLLINQDYYEQVIVYTAEKSFFTCLYLRLHNNSGVVGQRIRFTGRVVKSGGFVIKNLNDTLPSPAIDLQALTSESDFRSEHDIDLEIEEYKDRWEIDIDFGNVRPRDQDWTTNGLFIGSARPGSVSLVGELRGDNLPNPQKCELVIHFEVSKRPMTLDDVSPYLNL